jgi:hypothetical protein
VNVPLNITKELKRTFDLASLRREASKTLNVEEWRTFQKIKKGFDNQKRFEQRVYELEYDTRVEVACKRLINKAGEKNQNYKRRWFGNDNFDKSANYRQARRQVQAQHHKLLAHLETQEIRAVDGLLNRCEHRRQLQEKPKRDFAKAADRRTGTDRRKARPRS